MDSLTLPIAKLAKIGGAILVAWSLASHLDAAYQAHLDRTFATKADFQRLEEKVDKVLLHVDSDHAPAPHRK